MFIVVHRICFTLPQIKKSFIRRSEDLARQDGTLILSNYLSPNWLSSQSIICVKWAGRPSCWEKCDYRIFRLSLSTILSGISRWVCFNKLRSIDLQLVWHATPNIHFSKILPSCIYYVMWVISAPISTVSRWWSTICGKSTFVRKKNKVMCISFGALI